MKRGNQANMLAAVGATPPFAQLFTRLLLTFSPTSRRRHVEYQRVGQLFAAALAGDDDSITLRRTSRFPRRGLRKPPLLVVLLPLLVATMLLAWETQTIPKLMEMLPAPINSGLGKPLLKCPGSAAKRLPVLPKAFIPRD